MRRAAALLRLAGARGRRISRDKERRMRSKDEDTAVEGIEKNN